LGKILADDDTTRADIAFCRIEEADADIEKRRDPNIGDAVGHHATTALARQVPTPHQTRQMLRNPSLGEANGLDDLLLASRSIEEEPEDPDSRCVTQSTKDSGQEFVVRQRNRCRFDDGWPPQLNLLCLTRTVLLAAISARLSHDTVVP